AVGPQPAPGRAGATIAMHALVVRPEQVMATSLPSGPNRSEIAIDGTQLDEFLSVEDGREVSALIGLGVKAEMITEVAERDDAPKSRREKVFVPDSSPTHALEVLKQIPKEGMVAPEHVAHRTTLTN